MDQSQYAYRLAAPGFVNADSIATDSVTNAMPNYRGTITQQGHNMSGPINPNVSFNWSQHPTSGLNQPPSQPLPMTPYQCQSGYQGPSPPTVHKFNTPPIQPHLVPVHSMPNYPRSGESTGPYGPPAANGLQASNPPLQPSSLPLEYPAVGIARNNSEPNIPQINGPRFNPAAYTGSHSFRPPTPGTTQQVPSMMTPPNQLRLGSRTPVMDGHVHSPGSPRHPGPPPMSMPFRGIGPQMSTTQTIGVLPTRGQPNMLPPIGAQFAGATPFGPPPAATHPPAGTPTRAPPRGPPPMMMPTQVRGPPPAGLPPQVQAFTNMGNSISDSGPPRSLNQENPNDSFRNQGNMSQTMTSSSSESQQSSRTESPTNQLNYDDMEGQFVSPQFSGQNAAYASPAAPSTSQRQIMPPTSFPAPPTQGVMTNTQQFNSFQPTAAPIQQQQQQQQQSLQSSNYRGSLNSSFNKLQLQDSNMPINLLQERHNIPFNKIELQEANLPNELKKANCSPEVMASTINAIPNTQSLLNKSRLPLGILIHPFKDMSQLPVIQSSVIVRCRSCRTYINPFVSFVDLRRWKCNLCFRVNELPEDFSYDPVSKSYGEPQRRPEIRSATIEFVAPSEYMLRPPQPAVYLYLLDVSFNAIETGYLQVFCQTLIEELDRIPGDSRLQIGFVTYDSSLHFYNMAEELSQPHMYVVSDLEDVELPSPDSLLVNLQESRSLVTDFLNKLPSMFEKNLETGSALGSALQAAFKMMSPTGGRVTVVQTHLPTEGAGALKAREDPNERAGKNVQNLGPVTDFYKKLSLDCSAQQIAVDIFMLNSQYADIATIAGASKYSGGCLNYFPGFHIKTNPAETERFESTLRRYFTRKIGFEAVMRIRCTRGISIHTFHGNFFVRSTDLLSLPNINPEAGYGVQMSIDETLDSNYVSFQAALLYTSSKAERRIRVHTLCLPVTSTLNDVQASANQLAIIGLLAKMAVDKSLSASLSDAREAMINAAVDMLSAYGATLSAGQRLGQLPCPYQLHRVPLYILAMLKSGAFRVGTSTRLDDRVFAMEQCKNLPLRFLIQFFYPDLYPVHSLEALDEKNWISKDDKIIVQPPVLSLSSAHIDRHGAYLMDTGSHMYLWLGAAISDRFCQDVLGASSFQAVNDGMTEIPELENQTSQSLHQFVQYLNDQRPFAAPLTVIREDSRSRTTFLQYLIEDRTESTFSYVEFLQHIQKEVKS